MPNVLERDADKLDKVRVKAGVKMEKIIREQERVVAGVNKAIPKLNSDLKALKRRLDPYLEKNPDGKFDEKYYTLKDTYHQKLADRHALQQAREMAEESITAAKLHAIPGEFDRSKY